MKIIHLTKRLNKTICKYSFIFLLYLVSNVAYCNDKGQLLKIQNYLNSLKYIAAKFVQIDSNNAIQRGNFLLSRPGKLRWEYQSPKRITIIFNEDKIFYHDKELDQKSEYKTQDSLIYFLISPKINFLSESSNYYLQSFSKKDQLITLEIKKKHAPKNETLIITFNEKPLKLISVELKESLRIFINSVIYYKSLDQNLFRS